MNIVSREFKLGDVVYLLNSPNNSIHEYIYNECVIYKIYDKWHSKYVESIVVEDNDNLIRFGLVNINNTKCKYCNKTAVKIYKKDELNELELDIQNLNAVLCFKRKQKKELIEYISKNFSNWKFRGDIKL